MRLYKGASNNRPHRAACAGTAYSCLDIEKRLDAISCNELNCSQFSWYAKNRSDKLVLFRVEIHNYEIRDRVILQDLPNENSRILKIGPKSDLRLGCECAEKFGEEHWRGRTYTITDACYDGNDDCGLFQPHPNEPASCTETIDIPMAGTDDGRSTAEDLVRFYQLLDNHVRTKTEIRVPFDSVFKNMSMASAGSRGPINLKNMTIENMGQNLFMHIENIGLSAGDDLWMRIQTAFQGTIIDRVTSYEIDFGPSPFPPSILIGDCNPSANPGSCNGVMLERPVLRAQFSKTEVKFSAYEYCVVLQLSRD